ncbi:hypothetical protein [Streptomyces sp. NPDC048157]|uniref:hypothetical protein n=1 Tax=Streptomyces sp. NPDC048157 TaxID=3365503 RepID=UPI00371C256E
MSEVLAAVLLLAAGYGLGRWRLGTRLFNWADDASRRGRRSPAWWIAQPIGLIALAWMFTVHPRRSISNVRAWRKADETRAPVPAYDPNWKNRR